MLELSWWVVAFILVAIVVTFIAIVVSSLASRMHRINIRTDLARISLESTLGRRAAVVRAAYPELTPDVARAESILLTADAPAARVDAENAVATKLRRLMAENPPEPAMAIELQDVRTRVELSRRFYNDAVTDTLALRRHPLIRALRLTGTAKAPAYVDLVSDEVID